MSRFEHSKHIWSPQNPQWTLVEQLRRFINSRHGMHLRNYEELHQYSIGDSNFVPLEDSYRFWMDLFFFLPLKYSTAPSKVIEPGQSPYQLIWFPGCMLNYAENMLSRDDDMVACTTTNERGITDNYTYRQLRMLVTNIASALKHHGIRVGDRVAGVLVNGIIAVVLALAAASCGAIFTYTAPDMGAKGILDRYKQVQPKLIFVETEVFYAGKAINITDKVNQVITELTNENLKLGVLLPSTISGEYPDVKSLQNRTILSDFLSKGNPSDKLEFEQLPFNHPLCILYSSGTTGAPKCIVHSAGGILIQTIRELMIAFGVKPRSTLFQYTTTGWMMWTLMLAGLAMQTRLVLYDGSPFHPDLPSFLRMIDQQGVSSVGLSPRFLAEMQSRKVDLSAIGTFESLEALQIGGAILSPSLHQWAQREFGPKIRVASGCGGTDICSAFVISTMIHNIYSGEMPAKELGMKIEIFNDEGDNIESTGEPGEMVCTRPHPSVPLFFWGDRDGTKFRQAYFDHYPGIWRQGDILVCNPKTKGMIVLGRSDGVLNPKGIRFGSGDIYSVIELFKQIEDSLCIGQRRPQDTDERVILFIKMRPNFVLDRKLLKQVRGAIRKSLSPRHVPEFIFPVKDIPYTINGKKIEIAVKQIVSGGVLKPNGAIANPQALEEYYQYLDVEKWYKSEAKL